MENWGVQEWLNWQESINPNEIDLCLDRVRVVLPKLGIQPPADKTFLVAGTNGKGTTIALLEDILIKKGLRIGSYTSPHLIDYNERVRINKQPIDDLKLIESFRFIESIRNGIPLTYFEFGTLAAFSILTDLDCDVWLIEVGLGGRLDATNVIDPSVSIITNIDFDHQQWLGNTLDEIAKEKGGIIKTNTPCVYGDINIQKSIQEIARCMDSDLYTINRDFSLFDNGSDFIWKGKNKHIDSIQIPSHWAEGERHNLALALMSIEVVDADLLPTSKQLNEILEFFSLAGRFQIIQNTQTWILDVAHNPKAAKNLKTRLDSLEPVMRDFIIFSMMKDKDLNGFIEVFIDVISEWVVCKMNTERSFSSRQLEKKLIDFGVANVTVTSGPREAFDYASRNASNQDRVLVTGSFEIVGPAIKWIESN